MPKLAYPIILGKPWIEKNDVVYLAKRHCLRIGSRQKGMMLRESGWYENRSPPCIKSRVAHVNCNNTALASGADFAKILKDTKPTSENWLGAISIHDITRALEKKKVVGIIEVQASLPREIHHSTEIFLDDNARLDSALPPHRLGVDTKIKFKKDDRGRDMEIPWGPFYVMSHEELLVLRKTLTDLLEKNWIRASSSPGGAAVIFIKKPGGGLRFCVDY